MMHAPEMSPTLDDALRALDGASVTGVICARQLAAVRGFLEQLDQVRDVPAVVLEPAQAALMEGAYQAGVRCADESGHVLVVSLPAFLELCPPQAPAWRERLEWWHVGVVLMLCAFGALFVPEAEPWAVASILAACVVAWGVALREPSACTHDCNGGRACTCAPQPTMKELT